MWEKYIIIFLNGWLQVPSTGIFKLNATLDFSCMPILLKTLKFDSRFSLAQNHQLHNA